MRRFKSDIRTLDLMDALELISIGGFICTVALLAVIWSGSLPL